MSTAHTLLDPRLFSQPPLRLNRQLSEREFVDWCTGDTWAEWVDGEVIVMSPVGILHAIIGVFLVRLIGDFVDENDLGIVVTEPYQVRFGEQRRRRSPDILYVSARRQSIIREHEVDGAPDLIVEIVSPESQTRDRREKYLEYEAAGVREYWIVDPQSKTVEAYTLAAGKKFKLIPAADNQIRSKVLRGLYIDPRWLWRTRFPKVSTLLREFARKR